MSLNANTPTLETKETKTQRELFIVIDEMANTLEHFRKKLEQQKEDSSTRITQLEACLMATLVEFEHYIHQAIPAYTEKEEIGMLKSEIEKLKEENSKLKHDMCEKEILRKHLTETLTKKRPNKCGKQKPDKRVNINLDKIYH